MTQEEIISAALDLPLESRAQLVDRLMASVMDPEREEIDKLWAKEAEDRIQAYKKGEIDSVPGDLAFQRILKGLKDQGA
ncbi:MAG: addiction module protein [Desulfococcaceae bacterium]